jgi:hypothetical protein
MLRYVDALSQVLLSAFQLRVCHAHQINVRSAFWFHGRSDTGTADRWSGPPPAEVTRECWTERARRANVTATNATSSAIYRTDSVS